MADKFDNIRIEAGDAIVFNSLDHGQLDLGRFRQVNSDGNEVLRALVAARVSESANVVELYSGAGNFTEILLGRRCRVDCVELDGELVRAAEKSLAAMFDKELFCLHNQKAEDYMKDCPAAEILLLDPPRAGARAALEKVQPQRIPLIIYISCDLASFARDAKFLSQQGYFLEQVHFVDMFPQTGHVELLGSFRA